MDTPMVILIEVVALTASLPTAVLDHHPQQLEEDVTG
jgi:hypothetical protein